MGSSKPEEGPGALVLALLSQMQSAITELQQGLACEQAARKEGDLRKEKARTEADLLLAHHIAELNNLRREKEQIFHANTLLQECIVCIERHRCTRFDSCGHMVTCRTCADTLISEPDIYSRKCPLCRLPIAATQNTYWGQYSN